MPIPLRSNLTCNLSKILRVWRNYWPLWNLHWFCFSSPLNKTFGVYCITQLQRWHCYWYALDFSFLAVQILKIRKRQDLTSSLDVKSIRKQPDDFFQMKWGNKAGQKVNSSVPLSIYCRHLGFSEGHRKRLLQFFSFHVKASNRIIIWLKKIARTPIMWQERKGWWRVMYLKN